VPEGRASANPDLGSHPVLPSDLDHVARDDPGGGPCHGPHDPNGPRAVASLVADDRSEDGSNTLLHTVDGPSVLRPSGNGVHSGPNTHQPRRSPDRAPARALRNAGAAARLQYISQPAMKLER